MSKLHAVGLGVYALAFSFVAHPEKCRTVGPQLSSDSGPEQCRSLKDLQICELQIQVVCSLRVYLGSSCPI